MVDVDRLRPVERRVLSMKDQGLGREEIAARIRRSPEHVDRLIAWTSIPRTKDPLRQNLTALQRRVLQLRSEGEDHETIGRRFKKTPRFIRQVEGLAYFRMGLELLSPE